MSYSESVVRRIRRNGRPRRGTERVDVTRFSLTIPTAENKMLEVLAPLLDTNRHALSAALVAYGLEKLLADLKKKGELPDGIRLDK